jgi:hypothetical protein
LVFQGAIAWLAPRHLADAPFLPALEEYRKMLNGSLARQDLFEAFLAEQVILEGLGEVILTKIEVGLAKRAAPFGRLRRILIQQEEAHHRFGRRMRWMVLGLGDLFESIAEDPTAWAQDVRKFLPPWLSEVPV